MKTVALLLLAFLAALAFGFFWLKKAEKMADFPVQKIVGADAENGLETASPAAHSFEKRHEKKSRASVVVAEKMNGLTMVAPPEPFPKNPFDEVQKIGANWIAVVPYAFTPPRKPIVRYNKTGQHWWGEKPEGVAETVRLAHESGVRTMLKPQVWSHGNWTGDFDFETPADFDAWAADYEKYILFMAELAEKSGCELFCIGTEFRSLIARRPVFWTDLIKKIRAVYRGKLTYSANWDDWDRVPFWGELDFVGLGGYFPLVDAKKPEKAALVAAWQPIAARLEAFSDSLGKPILFTEYGYLSVEGCGWQNWELEKGIESRAIDEACQAVCFDALHTVFQPKKWWAGGFLWKWFPNGAGHEGYPERDYTPQGKAGEAILRRHFLEKE